MVAVIVSVRAANLSLMVASIAKQLLSNLSLMVMFMFVRVAVMLLMNNQTKLISLI
jgi:hypothetical protein